MKKEDAKKLCDVLNVSYIFLFVGMLLVESTLNRSIVAAVIIATVVIKVLIKRKFDLKILE